MTPGRRLAAVLAVALALGLLALALTRGVVVSSLCWNDELVFAAAGRHVADGDGPLSSFYHPDAIAARGLPLRDVHMPGQAFVLGAAFALLGPNEGAAILTSRLAFLAALLLLTGTVERTWGARAALATAALFVLFPPNVAFAHTAMSESVFTALVTAFLAAWIVARTRPSVPAAAAMAAVLGLGVFHHETILVFAPAALWAILRFPPPVRGRGLAAGGVVLGACLAAALPSYLARAPYPHALTEIVVASTSTGERASLLFANLLANLRGLPIVPASAWEWNHALQWATVCAAVALGWRAGGARREMAVLAALGFVGTWAALAAFYPIAEWRAVRVFMHTLPPALAVLGGALARPSRAGARWPLVWRVLVPLGIAVVAGVSLMSIARDRAMNDAFGRAYSDYLGRATAGHDVGILMATRAYRYGWDAYPVAVVVWQATDMKRVAQVERLVPLDAIVVRHEERRLFRNAVRNGAYRRAFTQATVPSFEGRYDLYLAEPAPAGAPP